MKDDKTYLQQLIQSHRKHGFMNLIISSVLDLSGFKNASGYLSNFICKSKLFFSSTPANKCSKLVNFFMDIFFWPSDTVEGVQDNFLWLDYKHLKNGVCNENADTALIIAA